MPRTETTSHTPRHSDHPSSRPTSTPANRKQSGATPASQTNPNPIFTRTVYTLSSSNNSSTTAARNSNKKVVTSQEPAQFLSSMNNHNQTPASRNLSGGRSSTNGRDSDRGSNANRTQATSSFSTSSMDDSDKAIVCSCGKDAVLLTVRKEGPNTGRQFYKCSGQNGANCNFFLWADDNSAQQSSQRLVAKYIFWLSWNLKVKFC